MLSKLSKLGRRKSDLVKAYRKLFASPEGQLVLGDLMKEGYMLKPTHDPKSLEAGHKNEGKRELVLHVLHKLQTDPVKLMQQIREYKQQEEKYELD